MVTKSYKGKRILVLDDESCNKGLTRETFSSLGIELQTAADSQQALEILSSNKVDALVADIKTSGIDFLSTVRQRFADLAIIVLTGYGDGQLATETQLGSIATTILTEPFQQEDIVVAVRNTFLGKVITSAGEALNKGGEKIPSRVLVAEDDDSQRLLLSTHLKKRGYDATCVEDGAAALEAVSSNDFDILVTDIMMPRMDGIELTQQVKKRRPRLPIIVFSAMEDVEASRQALRAGAFCYVVKPVNIQELSLFMDRAILADKLEQGLRQQNALLKKRTDELRKPLNELSEQPDLQATSRLATVKKLSANIAHELKNPLNSISASFCYVRSRIPKETLADQPKIAKHCDIIEAQIQRSKDLIESMLDFAKPDSTSMSEIQINDLLKESIGQSLAADEKIEVRYELDAALPQMKASEPKLKLVFGNLIINAVRAMKNNGILTVKTETDCQDDIKITFVDTGPGVPPSIIDRIFDPFFTTDQNQGLGLGLSICQETVKQYGGTIVASNAPDNGAVFTITLPQQKVLSAES